MGAAFIVDAVRTPFGKRGGQLASIHAIELGALPLRSLVARTRIDPADIDDVLFGCTSAVGELGSNVGRLCSLEAGFPQSVTGSQVNRLEASSDQAVHFAAMGVQSGQQHMVVAGGVASASRVPVASDRVLHGAMAAWPEELSWRFTLIPEGKSADLLAAKHRFSRADLDSYAVRSHHRAALAAREGRLEVEMASVVLPTGREARHDEGPRADLAAAALGRLSPAFGEGGLHTAGTAAAAVDGAAAVLIASEEALERHDLTPRARILASVCAGVDPTMAWTGPAMAARKALALAGVALSDVDVVEIHENFAAVPLACCSDLGIDPADVNKMGGALATGHARGVSGAKRLVSVCCQLERARARYGIVLTAVGFGQAAATLIERTAA